jgi:hypothetical protein
MLIQDKQTTGGAELVKARFMHNANYVVTAHSDSISVFDLRKPAIIVSQSSIKHGNIA